MAASSFLNLNQLSLLPLSLNNSSTKRPQIFSKSSTINSLPSPSPSTVKRRTFLLSVLLTPLAPGSLITPVSSSSSSLGKMNNNNNACAPTEKEDENSFPCVFNSEGTVVKTSVRRPKKKKEIGSSGGGGDSEKYEEEVLVVDGIEVGNSEAAKFDVLINAPPDWRACGPSCSEFAGSFVHVPRKPWRPDEKVRTCLRLGISELLKDVGAEEDDEVMVTLVPRLGKDIKVGSLRIEYSS